MVAGVRDQYSGDCEQVQVVDSTGDAGCFRDSDKLFSSSFGNYLPFFTSLLHLSSSVRLDGGRRTFLGFSRNI